MISTPEQEERYRHYCTQAQQDVIDSLPEGACYADVCVDPSDPPRQLVTFYSQPLGEKSLRALKDVGLEFMQTSFRVRGQTRHIFRLGS